MFADILEDASLVAVGAGGDASDGEEISGALGTLGFAKSTGGKKAKAESNIPDEIDSLFKKRGRSSGNEPAADNESMQATADSPAASLSAKSDKNLDAVLSAISGSKKKKSKSKKESKSEDAYSKKDKKRSKKEKEAERKKRRIFAG
ncbi:hypothetical protein FBU59_005871 [Linderina macrospora]|uniref:Uncharacterized protein n=1 Tax=Linderina macrospora TaxID=4868 RepID=A0ACC1J1D9_9FUNG|nr:hypothetical protein FBU59_005871 [Linderina macrospora]